VALSLLGNRCHYPMESCLLFARAEGVFANDPITRKITKEEAFQILRQAEEAGLVSLIEKDREDAARDYIEAFQAQGFDVLLSIGEYEENQIGSNCGQYLGRLNGTRA